MLTPWSCPLSRVCHHHLYYCFLSPRGDDGHNTICIVQTPNIVHSNDSKQFCMWPRGLREEWLLPVLHLARHWGQVRLCPLAGKIFQKTILYQGGLSNHAKVLGCWFCDPRHNGQLAKTVTGSRCLRTSILGMAQFVAHCWHSNGLYYKAKKESFLHQ